MNRTLILLISVLLIVISVLPTTHSDEPFQDLSKNDIWWDESWSYRKQVVIDHSQITDNLQNFPVLINSISSDFTHHAQHDGDDFIFITDFGSKLNHEIEYYNSTSGELVVWVNVTSISSTEDTIIWIYYGNSNCNNQQNTAGTWNSNYEAVWHLNDYTSITTKDSTYHNHAGTKKAVDEPTEISGIISKAQNFDGANDYIKHGDILDDIFIGPTAQFTVSCWIKLTTYSTQACMVAKHGDSNQKEDNREWVLYLLQNSTYTGNLPKFVFYPNYDLIADWNYMRMYISTTQYTTNVWYYVTSTYDATLIPENRGKVYVNGTKEICSVFGYGTSHIADGTSHLSIGAYVGESESAIRCPFSGIIDEVRICKGIKSDPWINASYQNQKLQSSFLTVGNEQSITDIVTYDDDDTSSSVSEDNAATDSKCPTITNITVKSSNFTDIVAGGGWENFSCKVAEIDGVSTVLLQLTKPDESTVSIPMIKKTGTMTYYSNQSLHQTGKYSYRIQLTGANDKVGLSSNYTFWLQPDWDVNLDGSSSILDIASVSSLYCESGVPGWIREDVDNNGIINICDEILVAVHLGEYWYNQTTGMIVVSYQKNRPPTTPIISGPINGIMNMTYTYTATSIDPDGDMMQYTFDWGDSSTQSSGFVPNGISYTVNHSWSTPGHHNLTVTVTDYQAQNTSTLIININSMEKQSSEFKLPQNIVEFIAIGIGIGLLVLLILAILIHQHKGKLKRLHQLEKDLELLDIGLFDSEINKIRRNIKNPKLIKSNEINIASLTLKIKNELDDRINSIKRQCVKAVRDSSNSLDKQWFESTTAFQSEFLEFSKKYVNNEISYKIAYNAILYFESNINRLNRPKREKTRPPTRPRTGGKSSYEILGVEPTATKKQIRERYRKLVKQCHPDKNKNPDAVKRFREITDAYDILMDDDKRREHDIKFHYR